MQQFYRDSGLTYHGEFHKCDKCSIQCVVNAVRVTNGFGLAPIPTIDNPSELNPQDDGSYFCDDCNAKANPDDQKVVTLMLTKQEARWLNQCITGTYSKKEAGEAGADFFGSLTVRLWEQYS